LNLARQAANPVLTLGPYRNGVLSLYLFIRAEIHQALLSQFSLLAELFIGKVTVKTKMEEF
jgi:hypothetical protein